MNDVILKRRIEAISGMYSHPDISKFIYNVLLHFETPIVDNLIKNINHIQTPEMKTGWLDSNQKNGISSVNSVTSTNFNWNLSQTHPSSGNDFKTTFQNPIKTNQFTNFTNNLNKNPGDLFNMNKSEEKGSIGSGQKSHIDWLDAGRTGMKESNQVTFNSNLSGKMDSHLPGKIDSHLPGKIDSHLPRKIESTQFQFGNAPIFQPGAEDVSRTSLGWTKETQVIGFPSQSGAGDSLNSLNKTEKITNNIYIFNQENIDKEPIINFKCSIAINNVFITQDISFKNSDQDPCTLQTELNTIPHFLFISKKINNSKNNIEYDVNLPTNYEWCQDELIFDSFIFPLLKFEEISKYNKEIFLKFHYFLIGFEYLLNNALIPCINNPKYKHLVNNVILDSITMPVLIAFGCEFQKSILSLKFQLMKNNEKTNTMKEFKWFKSLKIDKNYILQFIPDKEAEIANWILNCSCYIELIQLYDV